jgi:hypothetical protein
MFTIHKRYVKISQIWLVNGGKSSLKKSHRDWVSEETTRCEVCKVLIQALQQVKYFGSDRRWSFSWEGDRVCMLASADNEDARTYSSVFL